MRRDAQWGRGYIALLVPVVTGPGSFRKGKKCQSLSRDREGFHGAPNGWVLQSGGRSQQLEFGKSKIRMRLGPGARRKGRWQDLSHPDSLCLRSGGCACTLKAPCPRLKGFNHDINEKSQG